MTTMSIKTFLGTARKLPKRTSVLIRGPHGIGKSQVIRQLAGLISGDEGMTEGFEVIDRRLSQMTEGDIIGLPSTDGQVTRFNPPEFYKRACVAPCVLFLDELNRATPEVMQAAFQIVLDRELNGWKLHPDTRVYAAINTGASYNVNEVDPALLDRFWCIDLEPDEKDWLDWANAVNEGKAPFKTNVPPLLVDFIMHKPTWLDPPKNPDPTVVQVSRRSWEFLGDALCHAKVIENPENPEFYSISLGYVGTEASIALSEFAKSIDNRITGEEILDDWKKASKKLARMGQERLNTAIEKVAEYATTLDGLTAKQKKNLTAFSEVCPHELRIQLWSKLVAHGIEKVQLVKDVHEAMVEKILDVFGTKLGQLGVGITPNIPGMLQPKEKEV